MSDRSYQVLARKWRPQRFDDVVGQAAIVRTLSNALEQGRVAHAYCFSGIRGVGKTTIARLLAKGLNCRNAEAPTATPCGECEACVEIEESRSLDVIELDAASQTGVDSIRQLNEVARYTPSRDRYRVFIIDEAHMLSASAFNALLKTLEEPPPHVIFMLATTEPHKILPTVLSRCQHYPLGRISQAEITAQLDKIVAAEGVSVSGDGLAMVAIAADGSLRDAQSLLDKLIAFGGDDVDDETVIGLLGMVDRELLYAAADLIAEQDLAGLLGFVNRMVEQGVDLHQFTLDLLGHLRALLVVATVKDAGEILHLPDADLARLREQTANFAVDDLDRAFALVSASEYRIKQSEIPRCQLEMVLSRLARMPRLEPIEEIISQLRSGSGGGAPQGSGSAPGGASARGGSSAARGGSSARDGSSTARGGSAARDGGSADRGNVSSGPDRGSSAAPPRRPAAPVPEVAHAAESKPLQARPTDEEPLFSDAPPPIEEPPHLRDEPPHAAEASTPAPPSSADSAPPSTVPIADPAPPTLPTASDQSAAAPGGNGAAPSPDGAPRGFDGDVALIIDRLRSEKPLIAQIIERAELAVFEGDTLLLTFEEAGGIFRARLRDRSALASIEEAAEAALRRTVKVVARFDDEAEGSGPPPSPAVQASDPEGAARQQRDDLWQRAENEPLVRQFVDALRGNLTDVEDI